MECDGPRIDGLVRSALTAFIEDFTHARWWGKEHDCVNRFVHGFMVPQGLESGRSHWSLWFLGSTYADLGRREEAEAVLLEMMERRKSELIFNTFIASIHALLGRKDEAFRWLDLAFEEREFGLAGWGLHLPSWTFRGLEDDPRFTEILERVREAAQ